MFCCTRDQYKGPFYFAGSWQRGAKVLGVGLLVGGAAVVDAPLVLTAVGTYFLDTFFSQRPTKLYIFF